MRCVESLLANVVCELIWNARSRERITAGCQDHPSYACQLALTGLGVGDLGLNRILARPQAYQGFSVLNTHIGNTAIPFQIFGPLGSWNAPKLIPT